MQLTKRDSRLEAELAAIVSKTFPDMSVAVGRSDRWKRPCVLFRWFGFADLLPEERFHRLVGAIPEDVLESKLAGFVWLELAEDEPVDAFLKLPRSEDAAGREPTIYAALCQVGFFDRLGRALGRRPKKQCQGGFAETTAILAAKKWTLAKTREVKLVAIRHGAYCDCQLLLTVRDELAAQFPSATARV